MHAKPYATTPPGHVPPAGAQQPPSARPAKAGSSVTLTEPRPTVRSGTGARSRSGSTLPPARFRSTPGYDKTAAPRRSPSCLARLAHQRAPASNTGQRLGIGLTGPNCTTNSSSASPCLGTTPELISPMAAAGATPKEPGARPWLPTARKTPRARRTPHSRDPTLRVRQSTSWRNPRRQQRQRRGHALRSTHGPHSNTKRRLRSRR